ncbi:MAG: methyltransferase domain-containing protein [Pseudomonadota bacterium]
MFTQHSQIPVQHEAVIKPDTYFNVGEQFDKYLAHSMQPEIDKIFRELVIKNGPVHRLLDVGCASGRTSVFTKSLGVKELVGVEIDERAVKIARNYMDCVIHADVNETELNYPDDYFDMIFFTDILEHLVDPWKVLQKITRYLCKGGFALISLPNIGHIEVIRRMLTVSLRYNERGLMDSGHLRIFTQNMATEMIQRAGLKIERMVYRMDKASWAKYKHTDTIPLLPNIGTLYVNPAVVPPALRRTYFVRKFHILASRPFVQQDTTTYQNFDHFLKESDEDELVFSS